MNSDNVIQMRDYQNKRDLAVITKAIEEAISGPSFPIGMEPVIVVEGLIGEYAADRGALEAAAYDTAPSEYCAPPEDCA